MSAATPLPLLVSPVDALPADELDATIEWLSADIEERARASCAAVAADALDRLIAEERSLLEARGAALDRLSTLVARMRADAEEAKRGHLRRCMVLHKLRARRDAERARGVW